MKGLPLSYNRDLQEDKEPVFDAGDTLHDSLRLMARMLGTARFVEDRFSGELRSDPLMATELADYLARAGMPFRKAHGIVGDLVRETLRRGCTLPELPFPVYRAHSPLFGRDVYGVLDPVASIRSKRSSGSTNPSMVARAIAQWERRLNGARRRK
jgi:argininosuccinate lyase